jgi:hypothetical protein
VPSVSCRSQTGIENVASTIPFDTKAIPKPVIRISVKHHATSSLAKSSGAGNIMGLCKPDATDKSPRLAQYCDQSLRIPAQRVKKRCRMDTDILDGDEREPFGKEGAILLLKLTPALTSTRLAAEKMPVD